MLALVACLAGVAAAGVLVAGDAARRPSAIIRMQRVVAAENVLMFIAALGRTEPSLVGLATCIGDERVDQPD